MSPAANADIGYSLRVGDIVRVKAFSYKSVTLAYGPSFDAYVIVRFSPEQNAFVLR